MPDAYLVGHVSVKDAQKWAEYRSKVPATLAPWGAELLFRGERAATYSGELAHPEIVVIRFPDTDAIERWFHSDAYQALLPVREQAAEVLLLSYRS
ncbi:DUF1330 domain-containing protein [Comamonas sp. NLF-1-9]|uniref:DUF1330 domain-containing protein n=1 Tax=Comamonas sp. NLF-1-9 TaxID=2853163 RepID=UPI001C47577C|nr:DUF1330 domain-containing protein [Comamonas sp. NLF-1-9]QXL84660.1 DUF1330 domain-containing protein [Comamonas sp. NLF-1-9]